MIKLNKKFLLVFKPVVFIIVILFISEIIFRLSFLGVDSIISPGSYSPRNMHIADFVVENNDEILSYKMKADFIGHYKGAAFSTNKHGFRGADTTTDKPENTFRIAILGYSITMGTGVNNEEVFTAQLEQRLNASNDKDIKYEVLNFALGGHTVFHAIKLFKTEVIKYQPDVVLFPLFTSRFNKRVFPLYTLSDIRPEWHNINSLFQDFFIYRALRSYMNEWKKQNVPNNWKSRGNTINSKNRPAHDVYDEILKMKGKAAKEICLYTLYNVIEDDRKINKNTKKVRRWLDRNYPEACWLDTTGKLINNVSQKDIIFPGDKHPDAKTHNKYAVSIHELGEARGLW